MIILLGASGWFGAPAAQGVAATPDGAGEVPVDLLPVVSPFEHRENVNRLDDLQTAASFSLASIAGVPAEPEKDVAGGWPGAGLVFRHGRSVGASLMAGGALHGDFTREFIAQLRGEVRIHCLGPRIRLEGGTGLPERTSSRRKSL